MRPQKVNNLSFSSYIKETIKEESSPPSPFTIPTLSSSMHVAATTTVVTETIIDNVSEQSIKRTFDTMEEEVDLKLDYAEQIVKVYFIY